MRDLRGQILLLVLGLAVIGMLVAVVVKGNVKDGSVVMEYQLDSVQTTMLSSELKERLFDENYLRGVIQAEINKSLPDDCSAVQTPTKLGSRFKFSIQCPESSMPEASLIGKDIIFGINSTLHRDVSDYVSLRLRGAEEFHGNRTYENTVDLDSVQQLYYWRNISKEMALINNNFPLKFYLYDLEQGSSLLAKLLSSSESDRKLWIVFAIGVLILFVMVGLVLKTLFKGLKCE